MSVVQNMRNVRYVVQGWNKWVCSFWSNSQKVTSCNLTKLLSEITRMADKEQKQIAAKHKKESFKKNLKKKQNVHIQ